MCFIQAALTGILISATVIWNTAVCDLKMKFLMKKNYQGVAVVNYTDSNPAYTRIIEHKHFEYGTGPKTVITKEYSVTWQPGMEPYYPVNNDDNAALYAKYAKLAEKKRTRLFSADVWASIAIMIWIRFCAVCLTVRLRF